jgi:hypothetical protein
VQAPGLQLRREPTTRLLIPDVAVVRSEVLWGGAGTVAADEVLLAVEVVSPSSEMTDRITKPALYAAAGIAAYWRVELDDRLLGITIVLHRLAEETTSRTGWSTPVKRRRSIGRCAAGSIRRASSDPGTAERPSAPRPDARIGPRHRALAGAGLAVMPHTLGSSRQVMVDNVPWMVRLSGRSNVISECP